MCLRATSNSFQKVKNYKYVETNRRKCACAGLSALPFFYEVMAVADGIELFLTRANLLLNSAYRKIQDDPGGNSGDKFQLAKSVGERVSGSWKDLSMQLMEAQKIIRAKSDCPSRIIMLSVIIDDLRKSRGLHSVSAYRHGLHIQVQACGCSAE